MLEFKHDQPAHRYQAVQDGHIAGTCQYELDGSVITFTHTVVQPEFKGTGVGSALARHVLDESRAQGFKVVPACEFIKGYIARHSEYADLLAGNN
ncbi:GNAT family N-acetyltransferase [Polaromonas sp. YR568]|uniref:GNAT family N-acetyltransferase n=1 Tax=Polaromonas sp. YR568 TaxID=1855301 RepID=UPI00398C233B